MDLNNLNRDLFEVCNDGRSRRRDFPRAAHPSLSMLLPRLELHSRMQLFRRKSYLKKKIRDAAALRGELLGICKGSRLQLLKGHIDSAAFEGTTKTERSYPPPPREEVCLQFALKSFFTCFFSVLRVHRTGGEPQMVGVGVGCLHALPPELERATNRDAFLLFLPLP